MPEKDIFGAQGTPGANPLNLGFDVNIAGSYMGGPGSYHGDHNFSAAWRGVWKHLGCAPAWKKYHGQGNQLNRSGPRVKQFAPLKKAVVDKNSLLSLYVTLCSARAFPNQTVVFLPNYANENWNQHKKKICVQ